MGAGKKQAENHEKGLRRSRARNKMGNVRFIFNFRRGILRLI